MKQIINSFVNKSWMIEIRPYLGGVYHDPEENKAIATNGYLMMISSKDYRVDLSDLIINPKGDIIKGQDVEKHGCKYTNWRSVLLPERFTSIADVVKVSKEYKESLNAYLEECRKCKIRGQKNVACIGIVLGGVAFAFQYENFKLFLRGAKHIGATKIRYTDCEFKAIQAENEAGDKVLLMPMSGCDSLNETDVTTRFFKFNN